MFRDDDLCPAHLGHERRYLVAAAGGMHLDAGSGSASTRPGAFDDVVPARFVGVGGDELRIDVAAAVRGCFVGDAARVHLGKTTFLVPPVPDADTAARWSFTSGEMFRAGLPVAPATLAAVSASSAITIQLDGHGACVVHATDRRDEATYRAALDEAGARQSG